MKELIFIVSVLFIFSACEMPNRCTNPAFECDVSLRQDVINEVIRCEETTMNTLSYCRYHAKALLCERVGCDGKDTWTKQESKK
jgi:hypothetical protein